MRPWRAALVALVVGLAGFVGGVWFVSSEWAFRLIRLPSVPSASAAGPVRPGVAPPGPLAMARPRVEAVDVPALWNVTGGSGGLGRLAERSDLLPGAGCLWEVEPRDFTHGGEWYRKDVERLLLGAPAADLKTRRFRYHLTQITRPGKAVRDLRVVLFDAAGNRYPGRFPADGGQSSGNQESIQFRAFEWDDLPPLDDPAGVFFGVERIPPDDQKLAAEAARAEARAKKVELLPPPRIGEPFPIDLATVDGGRIRAADLKGRAVLIALTGPFPRGPFSLNLLRKEYPPGDLAVVNVSFHGDTEAARVDRDRLGEAAPLVLVPNDPTARRLWREGVELPYLPAYWVVDRDGILRFQCQWYELEDRIATTLGRPTRHEKFMAKSRELVAQAQAKARTQPQAAPPTPSPAPASSPAPAGKP